MEHEKLVREVIDRRTAAGESAETFLNGLLHSRPLNYWDYIQVDTLLTLQRPRTDFKDEEIFIMYHQVTELMLKMMLHEIRQMVEPEMPDEDMLKSKLRRINRYTNMLITSFDIMKDGMSYDDYNVFRTSLAPASGFQCAQFRFIEIYCTRLINLVNEEGRKYVTEGSDLNEIFEHIYWKDAGRSRETGEKSLTLRQFEDKYQADFVELARKMKGKTLEDKIASIQAPSPELIDLLREFDRLYNIEWPMVHLNTARHYLDKKGENQAATGGSKWKRYLHPQFQQRKFFPALWNKEELSEWGQITAPGTE